MSKILKPSRLFSVSCLNFAGQVAYSKDMDLTRIISRIKFNCNISDARFWGNYSLCGMLMRMRELYRSEHGLNPWDRIDRTKVANWISEREALWGELEGSDFLEIIISSKRYPPFDTKNINSVLKGLGLFYGAGYGSFLKPTFFLGKVKKTYEFNGLTVVTIGEELCRDLNANIASIQGENIILRESPLLELLWSRFVEYRGRRFGGLLEHLFSAYGVNKNTTSIEEISAGLHKLSEDLQEILVLHECGESLFETEAFSSLLISICEEREAELRLRGLRDMLADLSSEGPLRKIIEKKDMNMLIRYLFLFDPFRKTLFPQIFSASQQTIQSGDWSTLEKVCTDTFGKTSAYFSNILENWKTKKETEGIRHLLSEFN